jgi:ribulose-phosphate 3-epimerase
MGKDPREYRAAIERVCEFAQRIHIDFTDGTFAPTRLIPIEDAWWPVGLQVDFHVMYQKPLNHLEDIIVQQPDLVIIHSEAEGVEAFLDELEGLGIKRGIGILKDTPVATIQPLLDKLNHVLVFSGDLGYYGGLVDYALLDKVRELKDRKPELEIGWDGGIKDVSAAKLAAGGVDVLNVGGFIQNSPDPQAAYDKLLAVLP